MSSETIKATQLDSQDPLAHKRSEFVLPEGIIYLDGNSLGPLPLIAKERAEKVISNQWGVDLITSWNKHGWIELPEKVGDKIGALIGANPGEVVCCDSTSINLFKLLSLSLKLNPNRSVILSQVDNFPTDLYMAQGLESMLGSDQCQLNAVPADQLLENLTNDVAVLFLTQVNFRSGFIHDMKQLTQAAHDQGVLVIWDLAHSAGVLPVELNDCNVDFAIGCGYKYLNGGPGAPAFIFAAQRFHDVLAQPLAGWMGHAEPFAFTPDYLPAPNIKQFLAGTPAVISMSILDAALDVFSDTSIHEIRTKSLMLTDFFASGMANRNALQELKPISPTEHQDRGSQLSYRHPEAYAICQALIAEGIMADFRAPDILRIGFSPLFLRFIDLDNCLNTLSEIMQDKRYFEATFQQRNTVT